MHTLAALRGPSEFKIEYPKPGGKLSGGGHIGEVKREGMVVDLIKTLFSRMKFSSNKEKEINHTSFHIGSSSFYPERAVVCVDGSVH